MPNDAFSKIWSLFGGSRPRLWSYLIYLRAAIKTLYLFIRDQGYEPVNGKNVRRIASFYGDAKRSLWYPEGISRIMLTHKAQSSVSYFFADSSSSRLTV
jgi:hypothetical protein